MKREFTLLLFIGFPLFWFLRLECENTLKDKNKSPNIFLMIAVMFSGKAISGVFELMIKRNIKEKPVNEIDSMVSTMPYFGMIQFRKKTKGKKQMIIYISLLSLIQLVSIYLSDFIIEKKDYFTKNQLKNFQIIPTALFVKWIIYHRNLYLHQLVSFIAISISMCILLVYSFINSKDSIASLAWYTVQFLLVFSLNSLRDTMDKWFMEIQSFSPYLILFYEGMTGIVYMAAFMSFIPLMPDTMKENASVEGFGESIFRLFSDYQSALYLVGDIFLNCGYYICLLLIFYYYSPTYKCVIEVVYSMGAIIEYQTRQGDIGPLTCYIVVTIVILFFSLLYTEMIIIYKWGLHENTLKEISKRGHHESKMIEVIEVLDGDNGEEFPDQN